MKKSVMAMALIILLSSCSVKSEENSNSDSTSSSTVDSSESSKEQSNTLNTKYGLQKSMGEILFEEEDTDLGYYILILAESSTKARIILQFPDTDPKIYVQKMVATMDVINTVSEAYSEVVFQWDDYNQNIVAHTTGRRNAYGEFETTTAYWLNEDIKKAYIELTQSLNSSSSFPD